jgi:UDP-N-acetylglucosamine 2-epimerase (non-hydrolysing)
MSKLKLLTIVGTRPEIIRLCQIIKLADVNFNHILVHTGQNYDYTLNEIFFEQLNIRQPDYFLGVVGQHLGETMGNVISKSYEVLLKEMPDALLVLGDTNSVLCTIAAKRLKIPIFHMEAGNRCFDQNVPEEINRKISDHISDINLTYTEHSRRYLLSEGFRKDHIFVTGSPLNEVLIANNEKINNSEILKSLNLLKNKYIVVSIHREENIELNDNFEEKIKESKILTNLNLQKGNYFVVSSHREENIDNKKNFYNLIESINGVAEKYNIPIIFSTHPRTMNSLKKENIKFNKLVLNIKPLGFFDYVQLQMHSYCVLSDSGTLSEESAMIGFPAVSIRTSTERPEAIDSGSIILGGINVKDMLNSIDICVSTFRNQKLTQPHEYTIKDVSIRVIKLIQSYTNVVNREIWKKNEN